MNKLIYILLICFNFLTTPDVDVGDWKAKLNCVDSSVINFLNSHEINPSEEEYARAITNLGLDRNMRTRTLADALAILRSLGLPSVALQASDTPQSLQDRTIAFFQVPNAVAHCVYVEQTNGKRVVWDTQRIQIDEGQWRTVDCQAFIVSQSAYQNGKTIEFLKIVFLGLIAGFVAVFIYRQLYRQETNLIKSFILIAILSAGGCTRSHQSTMANADLSKATDSNTVIHDIGIVSGGVAVESFRLLSPVERKCTSFRQSCGCLNVDFDFDNFSVEKNREYEIPIKVDISKKTGPFSEQFQIHWSSPPSPQTFVVRGFVVRPPIISPSPIVLYSDQSKLRAEGEFEVILSHSLAMHPKLLHVELTSGEESNISRIDLSEKFVRESWVQPGLGVVRASFVVTADFSNESVQGLTDELEGVLRWSDPKLDARIRLRFAAHVPIMFATESQWLNYRPHTTLIDTIPLIRVDSKLDCDRVSVRFSRSELSGKIEENEASAIRVICQPESQDSFHSSCDLLVDGAIVDTLEVLVN